MKKHIKWILSLVFAMGAQSAFAYDMENGVWKNLNEEHEQTVNNKSLVSGMLFNRIYQTNTFDSDNANNEYKDTYLKSRLGVNLKLSDNFSIKTVAKLENVANSRSNGDGTNRFFENEGAFLDELVLGYDYKNFSAIAGKFNPNFGDAWKIRNGIWVSEIAAEYEQKEKLGFGFIQRAGDRKKFGEYVFGASVFTNDRKNLDNSTITARDSAVKSDGIPGDTRSPESYVLSTDIYYDFGNDENLSYHFSYLNLAINDRQNKTNIPAKINDEKAFALNMNYKYPINNNFLLDSFVEYTNISNMDGDTEKNADFLTVNFTAYIFKDYFVTLARAKEKQIKIGENGTDKIIDELSFGYKLDHLHPILKGLTASGGYQRYDLNNKTDLVRDKAFGVAITHKLEF
jgi:hypothetical protein